MSPSIPGLGTTLQERIDALHAWPAGEALPEAAEKVVGELLGAWRGDRCAPPCMRTMAPGRRCPG